MRKIRLVSLAIPAILVASFSITSASAATSAYEQSFQANGVKNVYATTQTSCYRPEVPYAANAGSNDGFSGETTCPPAVATTGEDTGAAGQYATQVGSNPGFATGPPVLAKNHSESDIRVDPTNPRHLIGSVKWFASAEGYNHVLGFYESFDGGATWPVQGHIPGYEGWTDNTDPVGAFDGFGNYYELILPYQFYYNADGSHNFQTNPNKEPNPAVPAEVISVSVRPQGATTATQWFTTHKSTAGVTGPDFVAPYAAKGQEPDKQWITIDTNPNSPFYNTIYAMWAVFDGINSKPFVSTAMAKSDGTHTDWSTPLLLPTVNNTASDSYLLPHVAPDGTVYTSVTNFPGKHSFCCFSVSTDKSTDGGKTWSFLPTPIQNIAGPAFVGGYQNTTFTDGIDNTFAVGTTLVNHHYPLYIAYNQRLTTVANVLVTASYDGGVSWTAPIQVNDNASAVDEFQPNLAVAASGTVSVNFYDRRLACPKAGTTEAVNAGLALDLVNPNFPGTPPYSATNYCVNTSIQFYTPTLVARGRNIRLSQHTWDPQLNSPYRFCVCNPIAGFIGDYFGNTTGGGFDYTTSVSTFNDGGNNPNYFQQQVVATIGIP